MNRIKMQVQYILMLSISEIKCIVSYYVKCKKSKKNFNIDMFFCVLSPTVSIFWLLGSYFYEKPLKGNDRKDK